MSHGHGIFVFGCLNGHKAMEYSYLGAFAPKPCNIRTWLHKSPKPWNIHSWVPKWPQGHGIFAFGCPSEPRPNRIFSKNRRTLVNTCVLATGGAQMGPEPWNISVVGKTSSRKGSPTRLAPEPSKRAVLVIEMSVSARARAME